MKFKIRFHKNQKFLFQKIQSEYLTYNHLTYTISEVFS